MFPIELVTMGVSTLASFGMKVFGSFMENKAEERKLLLGLREQDIKQHELLVRQSGGFAITRRVIALSAVASLIVWPSVAGLFHVPIHFPLESTESTNILFGLFSSKATESFMATKMGFVYFEWHKHVILAIIGLYFGQTLANKR